jgi:hypothetical protein
MAADIENSVGGSAAQGTDKISRYSVSLVQIEGEKLRPAIGAGTDSFSCLVRRGHEAFLWLHPLTSLLSV